MKNKQAPDREIDKLLALFNGNRYAEGEALARQLTQRYPQNAFAWKSLGACLTVLGRKSDAVEAMKKSAKYNPNDAEAHFNLGTTLNDLERWSEAESYFRRAVELNPAYIEAYNNLGDTLTNLDRPTEAEAVFRRAIEQNANGFEAHYNLANALRRQGRFVEAEQSFRRALELQPANIEVRHNLGFLLLSLGRYTEGWPYYESRYHPKKIGRSVLPPELDFPQWQGESLAGKSLLIWPEQGFGDEIQFARFISLLKHRGVSRLTLVCKPPLKELLKTLSGVDAIIVRGDPVPAHDYWAFPLSLPLLLGTTLETIPAALPYLSADPQRMTQWKARLPNQGFKVGLVWQGNTEHKNDSNRSLTGLKALAPLWSVPGVRFVSLQKGQGEDEAISPPSGQAILALGNEIQDFADTAAIVSQLDLVICVDTSIAHLAGALGKACWVLLPAVGTDWRWLHERTDSPWYPGVMRLFRQTRGNTWDETVERVAVALAEQAKGPHRKPPQRAATKVPDKEISQLSALFNKKRFAEGETLASQIVENHPESGFAWYLLGVCRMSMGKNSEAVLPMQKAAEFDANNAEVHCNLGIALKQHGRLAEAEESYRRAIKLKPGYVEGHYNLAITLSAQGRHADAENTYRRVIQLNPKYAKAHINLGNALKAQGKANEAENSYRHAIKLQPGDATAHYNLGTVLSEQGRLPETEASYRTAIQLDPAYAQAYGNLANTLKELGRAEDAESNYRKALQLRPTYPQASNNYGILLLSLGRYAEGWPYYEARYDPAQNDSLVTRPRLPFPQWQGEALAGKSLVIWREQGFGDEIQFARYATLLKARVVSRLTVVCQPPLRTLLQSLAGVDAVVAEGDPLPLHDYWAFPLSLPLRFGTTLENIPAPLPYLSADPQHLAKWQPRLPADGFKVGLVWRGNAGHQNDAHRSLPGLAALSPLWSVPGVRFISLQKGQGEEDAASPPDGQAILALGGEIADFADTAAIVAQLDLVICVDTSIAHLAGALGKPCWVLLPARGTDWRWLQERNDSPWYPGVMRLFRQTTPGRWDDTVSEIAHALEQTVAMPVRPSPPKLSPRTQPLKLAPPARSPDEEAIASCRQSLERNPDDAQVHYRLATLLTKHGRPQEAEDAFRTAISLQPDYLAALSALGNLMRQQGCYLKAEEACRRAVDLQPDVAMLHYNLGNSLLLQQKLSEAKKSYLRAIELRADYAAAYVNLGKLLEDEALYAEAESAFRTALTYQPDFVECHWNLSLLLLTLGRYAEAWPHYESRYDPMKKDRPAIPPKLPYPQWQGEELAGKSLVVWTEQGFGDEIQFVRYAALLKETGLTRLTVFCQPALKDLLQTVAGVDAVIAQGEPLPRHDYWVFPLSLPLHFGTTLDSVPAKLPYIVADPQRLARWRPRLPISGLKIGLVWKGSAIHKNNAQRSLPGLGLLAPLWSIPNLSFVSLQKGDGENEATHPPKGQPILALGNEIQDFADTAAIVAQLDLVICVDTSVAHLAGAMGKPCWVLLPARGTDWRWLQGRNDSPWYPGVMRLFRQGSSDDWAETINRVRQALTEWSDAHKLIPAELPTPDTAPLAAMFNNQRYEEALSLARTLSLSHPDNTDVWKTLGACLATLGRTAEAIAPLQTAARLRPDDAEAQTNLAIVFKQLGRLPEAEICYRQLVKLQPQNADALVSLANVLRDTGRSNEAEETYRQAITLNPNAAPAWFGLGITLSNQERLEDAEASYRRAIAISPNLAQAYSNLANTLKKQGRLPEAEALYREAIQRKPQYALAWFNLATTLSEQGRLAEAETLFEKTLDLQPNYIEACINLSNAQKEQGNWSAAERNYRRAIKIRADSREARYNLGILLLTLGRYSEAWPYYEDRYHPEFKARSQEMPQLPFPQWRGEPLAGKSLMIWPEQGMGDEIQFARYAPLLKAQGVSRLTLACQPELKTVMSSINGVDAVATNGEPLPLHDYWVLPLSLPLHFGTTLKNVPSTLPYLSAPPDRLAQWQARLPREDFKVGLVWRGNTKHQNDANRSLTSLAVLAPLWSVPGVSFVSLQKGQGEDEANAPPNGQAIIALGKEFRDFADTAAVIAQLDLVICIDTSVAHLTGALGKPCWVLLPAVSTDWRWLLERTDSPWYPQTMRLFRQAKAGDWATTLAEVTQQLRKEVDARKSGRPVTPAISVKEPPTRELEHLASLFNGKRFAEGVAVATPLSERYPQNAFIWKALGACLTSLGRQSEAMQAMQKAASLNPDDPEAQLNLAIAFKTLGRLTEAESCYRQLTRLQPSNADRHASLGSVLGDLGKREEAEASYRRSLELNPGNFRVHGNLANVLKALGRTSEAESAYRRAIELKPDYMNAHFNLAIALQDQGRLDEAESLYRKVLELNPDQVHAYINLGTLLTKQGRLAEAEQGCRRAIDIKPDYTEAHVNLANILHDQKRLAEAEASNRQAIALQPDFVPAHGNLGNVLLELNRFSEAESSYKRAIELDPSYAQAYGNMGNALKEQGRFDEAESSYRHAMALDPNYAQARSNLGILLLYLSRFTEGWPHYEARYDPRQDEQWITLPDLPFPQWQGESLLGKSIALWPEQGFGDEIQFARYATVLKAKGATSVTLVCKPALKTLLETVPDIDLTITQGEPLPPHDYWAFPLSLPLHLGTTLETIPATLPYLFADPERIAFWRPQMPDAKLKVGLVWQGAGGHKNDANRSLTGLAALKPLWSIPGVSFVSLQKGRGEDEANSPPDGQPIVALGGKVRDFADTAAILEQLDLLICVDTSTAHLAGALGKPCWVLVPSVGTDWRWLHERCDSPWYPEVMRLFRQKSMGRWEDTIQALSLALAEWAVKPA